MTDSGERRAALTRVGGLSVFLMGVMILAVSFSGWPQPEEKLSPLQVGRYAVRAERQSADYDEKAERQIAFATDNDNAASGERDLAAKEESRARQSAYLAADLKSRIDKTLEEGRDQVWPGRAARAAAVTWRAPRRSSLCPAMNVWCFVFEASGPTACHVAGGQLLPQSAGPRAGSRLFSRWGRRRPAAMDSDGTQTEACVVCKGISVLAGECCAQWKYQCTKRRAPRTASCACLHQYARRDSCVVRFLGRGAIEESICAVVRALQVNQATKLKSKAGRLQEMAAELLSKAKTEKEGAAALKAKYYKTMDDYGKAVQKIDDATMNAQKILDQMNAQSLTLAQVATQYGTASGHGANPGASAAVALKGQLQKAQQDLAAITSQKAKADEDTQTARQLADQYQPMIIDAEKDKRSSDFKFQEFARLTQEADSLQTRADALLSRADTIDGLIQVCECVRVSGCVRALRVGEFSA